MSEIIRIINADGIHPSRLDQAALEQKLWEQGRFDPHIQDMIFVFGSNEAGRHGAGAALHAYKHRGARMKEGFGPMGTSFAIPTKDFRIRTLRLRDIKVYVNTFNIYADSNPSLKFQITQLGCGLAGLRAEDMATMFTRSPDNCYFDTAWMKYLPGRKFWGTG